MPSFHNLINIRMIGEKIYYVNEQIRRLSAKPKKTCVDRLNRLKFALKNMDMPGERMAEFGLMLRIDPMNLLGIMPAKEG